MSTLELSITLPEGEDDPTFFLQRVLTDMRSQGRWQKENLTGGVALRNPNSFERIGTLSVHD